MKKILLSIRSLFILAFIIALNAKLQATHLRAGEITVTQVCPSRTYQICLKIYVNTEGVKFGGGTLSFGDGDEFITDEQNSVPFGDPSDNVGLIELCVTHTYPGTGQYKVSYAERNRNADINNINGGQSVNISFFLETIIEIDPFKGCNNSPRLLIPPIDKACTGAAWFHNPGAYDLDGDSLSYKMILPRQGIFDKDEFRGPALIANYTLPNDASNYSTSKYNNAQEDGTGPPLFFIDPVTGTITWDAPGEEGEYNIAFLIIEWRKVDNVWLEIGSITRDMQIIVEECDNKRPLLEIPPDTCVVAGSPISVKIYGTDPDGDKVKIEVFSQTLILDSSPADYSPKNVFQSTVPSKAEINFVWNTKCEHVKQQAYQVVFKITDDPPSGKGAKLVSFATWNIKVVGPQPIWNPIAIAPNRSVQLDWKNYNCSAQADSMEIWRRIDSVAFTPVCETGMPDNLGYEKIKTLKIGETTYLDTNNKMGLPPGAVVCYRLVAIFPATFGNTEGRIESLVSDEACVGPFPADAPVMTNVTVDTTDRENGFITVKWTHPFDLDPLFFPPPYKYDVYRATGFSGDNGLTLISNQQTDTSFVDDELNTLENVFNYRVVVFDNSGIKIDTSAIASTVRLSVKSLIGKLELNWAAKVPWSLRSDANPLHVIYRGNEGDKEDQLVNIGTIQATNGALKFTDNGPLEENKKYCYRVETRGGYGYDDTSKIPEPLINFSQIVCAQPSDTIPPCRQDVTLDIISCEQYYELYGCKFNNFSNKLIWTRSGDKRCRDDISHYRIYYSTKFQGDTTANGDYKLLVDLADRPSDTTYIDKDLPSFARCYRLVAVDRSGNESPFSNEVCNDNCPNYQLPNVFTPQNNDNCNDYFSAYSDRNIINGNFVCGGGAASNEDLAGIRKLCPRFVNRIDVVIVDRWGKQVFFYSSRGENGIYIDWDGKDDKGKELSTGTYFYSARVTFETLKPEDRIKIIKGWVQLVRPN